jgi:hypothetical protein
MSKHLDFYYKCLKTGELVEGWWGLCACAYNGHIDEKLLDLFQPTDIDACNLIEEGYSDVFWGGLAGDFTPLRQNIVLLMACLNGEEL